MHVNRWIESHARLRPNKLALVDRVRNFRLTYLDLYRTSQNAACRLEELGVKPGDRVAVLSQNRVEFVQLFLACARVGAILVPLNWRLSTAELEQVMADCEPVVLFVEPDLSEKAPLHPHTLAISDIRGHAGKKPRIKDFSEDTPVAIFYTGGTTGTPKGALLTHRSLQANALNTIVGWGLSPEDVAPVFTPMFHTGGLNVFATPLLCLGGTVVITGAFEAESALELLEEESCTVLFMVPTMFDMLRKTKGFSGERLSEVRLFISGGAPCPKALFEAYWEEGLPLKQGYGLTEAGPNNFGVSAQDARERVGTVGFPLPGVKIKLLTEEGREAEPGEVGELCVSGPHLMNGYFNRPTATIDGWLHTGDLAYRDEDGYFFICGRSKEMYISGGENVFPAEIEEVMLDHPQVEEVAVIGVPHEKWGEVGRAYVVLSDRCVDDLEQFCRQRLAGYKVPKEIIVTESLPKSAAGKVLKKLLVNS